MRRPIELYSIIIAICVLGLGCGGAQKPGAKGGSARARELVPLRRLACEGDSDRLADANGDGYANVRHAFDGTREVCTEIDLNMDHRIDLMRMFGQDGKVSLEQYDLDFDGRLDLQTFYEAGKLVRKELDTNFDRMVDTWVWCDGPRMARLERDRHHRGTVDTWEDYKAGLVAAARYDDDNDGRAERWEAYRVGRLVRVDYDTNKDGKPDRSDTNVTSSSGVAPDGSSCDGNPLAVKQEPAVAAPSTTPQSAPASAAASAPDAAKASGLPPAIGNAQSKPESAAPAAVPSTKDSAKPSKGANP